MMLAYRSAWASAAASVGRSCSEAPWMDGPSAWDILRACPLARSLLPMHRSRLRDMCPLGSACLFRNSASPVTVGLATIWPRVARLLDRALYTSPSMGCRPTACSVRVWGRGRNHNRREEDGWLEGGGRGACSAGGARLASVARRRLGPVLQKSMAAGADAQAAPSAPSALVRVILDTKAPGSPRGGESSRDVGQSQCRIGNRWHGWSAPSYALDGDFGLPAHHTKVGAPAPKFGPLPGDPPRRPRERAQCSQSQLVSQLVLRAFWRGAGPIAGRRSRIRER